MKAQTIGNYFVRCDQPGCNNGFLGYGEACGKCQGYGVVLIPELKRYFAARKVIGYAGLIALVGVIVWSIVH